MCFSYNHDSLSFILRTCRKSSKSSWHETQCLLDFTNNFTLEPTTQELGLHPCKFCVGRKVNTPRRSATSFPKKKIISSMTSSCFYGHVHNHMLPWFLSWYKQSGTHTNKMDTWHMQGRRNHTFCTRCYNHGINHLVNVYPGEMSLTRRFVSIKPHWMLTLVKTDSNKTFSKDEGQIRSNLFCVGEDAQKWHNWSSDIKDGFIWNNMPTNFWFQRRTCFNVFALTYLDLQELWPAFAGSFSADSENLTKNATSTCVSHKFSERKHTEKETWRGQFGCEIFKLPNRDN